MAQISRIGNDYNQRKSFKELQTMLTSHDGINIFVRAWIPDSPLKVLICIQGLGGHGGYYRELACELTFEDTIVVAPDLRGHGFSEGVRGDIDGFNRYLADVDITVTWAKALWPDFPMVLMGESMGASVVIQYDACQRYCADQIPLAGLVFVSQVLSSAIRPTLGEVLHFMRSLLIAPKKPLIAVTGREELGCRDSAFNALLRTDPLFVRRISVRFLINLAVGLWQSKRRASQIHLPLLVLLGGHDYVSLHSGTAAFLRRVPAREQRIVTFPQAYHCLLHDPETPAVVRILNSWPASVSGT
jgi:alpha-beta hydrolase superfamily lysophospholipase